MFGAWVMGMGYVQMDGEKKTSKCAAPKIAIVPNQTVLWKTKKSLVPGAGDIESLKLGTN